jgi:hypothetical protein
MENVRGTSSASPTGTVPPKRPTKGTNRSPRDRPDHHQVRPAQNVEGSLSLNGAREALKNGRDEIIAVIGWMMRTSRFDR